MRCTVCDQDKEINQFQTYWHSTQQKMRTRKQCTECLYEIRAKKNPDKYYSNKPEYKKCMDCNEWKLIETEFYHRYGKPYLNRCKGCELDIERTKRKTYLQENCGCDRIPPKPNVYSDEHQKACTFEFMKILGYKYDEPTGVWTKPGYKEIKDGKIIFPTLNVKAVTRRKISPTKFDKIIILREQGLSYEKIAEQLGISDTTVYKHIRKWKSQSK